jgi:hypothetical protein
MKQNMDHRFKRTMPKALLLLMLMLSFPMAAQATPSLYTYSGPPFLDYTIIGSEWTTADSITVSLTFDPGSGPGSLASLPVVPPFVISAGSDVLDTVDPAVISGIADLAWNSSGQIIEWFFIAKLIITGPNPSYTYELDLDTVSSNWDSIPPGSPLDLALIFSSITPGVILADIDQGWTATNGTWASTPIGAPVPEPATMLLLGSGLICLAGYGYGRKELFKK